MAKHWIAINVVLLLVAGMLGWRLYVSGRRYLADNDPAKIQPAQDPKQKMTLEGGIPPLQAPQRYNAADFGVISAKNLFSESRGPAEEEQAPAVQTVPELAIKPTLVGVTISGDSRLALIVDPSKSGPGRQTETKRLGDAFQGYIITDITQNQMVLEYGSRREIIPLFDGSKHPGGGGKTPIVPTRVVSFGAGAAGAAGVAQPVRTAPTPVQAVATPAFGGSPARSPAAPPATSQARSAAQTARPIPGAGRQSQPTPGAAGSPGTGTRIIRTPFGDIVRPDNPNP